MNASRTNLRRCFVLFVLVMMDVHLQATMLVVIKISEGYWIGADSARENEGKCVETVCRFHATSFGVLLKAGNSQGITRTGHSYSIDREIKRLLAASRVRPRIQGQSYREIRKRYYGRTSLPYQRSRASRLRRWALLRHPFLMRDLFVELDVARCTFETRHQGLHWRRIVGRAHE